MTKPKGHRGAGSGGHGGGGHARRRTGLPVWASVLLVVFVMLGVLGLLVLVLR